MTRGKTHKARRVAAGVGILALLALAAAAWYVGDYYHADAAANEVMADVDGDADGVLVRELDDGSVAFVADGAQTGLVFYPGAKVQPEAYAPLLEECAHRGVTCVLVKPPFNLAVLDADAAEHACTQLPEVQSWLVAGHSVGGVAACAYASKHTDAVDGVALLASYPAADLSSLDVPVVEIVGTNDTVLNRDNYEAAQGKLPANTVEHVIEGGNHANFGNYGRQDGDGTATIGREEQQAQTADYIAKLAQAA